MGYKLNMRISPRRHTLATLRIAIGLTQKEMATLVQRSPRTIQAIELGQLPLSEDLGVLIAEATGVDFGWLMEGDPHEPPRKGMTAMGMGYGGTGNYGRPEFEFHRAFLQSPVASSEEMKASYQATLKSKANGDKIITMPLPVLKKALLAKKRELMQSNDSIMMRKLKAILDQTITAETGDLIRWKIGEFLQSLGSEYRLSDLPSKGGIDGYDPAVVTGYDPADLDVLTLALPAIKLPTTSKKEPLVAKRKRKSKMYFSIPPTDSETQP